MKNKQRQEELESKFLTRLRNTNKRNAEMVKPIIKLIRVSTEKNCLEEELEWLNGFGDDINHRITKIKKRLGELG